MPAEGVILDGIALGYKKVQSHIVQPWQHAQDPTLAVGCAFADRIFLPDRTTRELLMSFALPGMPSSMPDGACYLRACAAAQQPLSASIVLLLE